MIKVFDNVPGQTILFPDDDFYHFVEMVWTEIKDFYYPWEHSEMEKKIAG